MIESKPVTMNLNERQMMVLATLVALGASIVAGDGQAANHFLVLAQDREFDPDDINGISGKIREATGEFFPEVTTGTVYGGSDESTVLVVDVEGVGETLDLMEVLRDALGDNRSNNVH